MYSAESFLDYIWTVCSRFSKRTGPVFQRCQKRQLALPDVFSNNFYWVNFTSCTNHKLMTFKLTVHLHRDFKQIMSM